MLEQEDNKGRRNIQKHCGDSYFCIWEIPQCRACPTKNIFIFQRCRRRGAGEACAPPSFGLSFNPIRTKGGKLCPPYYYFLDNAASLYFSRNTFHCNLSVRFTFFTIYVQSNVEITLKNCKSVYNYFIVLGAAIRCNPYSETTVESWTHLKTVEITSNIFAV